MKSTDGSTQPDHRPADTSIVYQYFALYRQPIFRTLTDDYEQSGSKLTLLSSAETNVPSIQLIDPSLADIPVRDGGFRWEFLKNRWFGRHILWQSGLIKKSVMSSSKVIVFLGNPYFLSTWIAAVAARMAGKRVLFWTHGVTRRERGLRLFFRACFYRLAHGLILYGNWARKQLVEHFGLQDENLYVIFNSLDYEAQVRIRQHFSPEQMDRTRRELFPESSMDPVLVYIGRVTKKKRLDLLLNAATQLLEAGQPVNVLIIGDGPALEGLQQSTVNHALGRRVCFRGACYNEEETGVLLGSSDLCVVPDNIGLTAIHALGYGTPVVTHGENELHGPEFEAIIPGHNGACFERGNVANLVDVIRQWLQDHPDRDEVRKNCHQVVDRFYNPDFQSEIFRRAVNGLPAENHGMELT